MKRVRDICSLLDDHDAIEAVADQLIRRARPAGADAEECHLLLRRFEHQLIAHRVAEDLFLKSSPNTAFEAELRTLRDDFSELAEAWTCHLARWTEQAIVADRAAFAQETTDMMTVFKLRIARENNIIHPLVLERGRIARYAA